MLILLLVAVVATSSLLRYYPTHKKAWKVRRATAVIVSMVLIVVACIAAVYAFRYAAITGFDASSMGGDAEIDGQIDLPRTYASICALSSKLPPYVV